MQQKTNDNVLKLMDTFLTPIRQEKTAAEELNKEAADSIEEVKHTNSAAPVTPEADKGDGTSQGEFGKEKQGDIKEGADGAIAADSPAATNEPGGSDKPTDDQGTKSLASDQALSQPSVTVNNTQDPQEDNKVNDKGETGGHDKAAKMKRNVYLAQNIKALKAQEKTAEQVDDSSLSAQLAVAEAPVVEKQADEITPAAPAPAPEATPAAPVEKQAEAEPQLSEGDQLYIAAFNRGIEKRADDEAELAAAGMDPAEAAASLDAVAEENPAAVLPEEAGAAPELMEEGLAGDPAIADELAAAEGVPAEEAPAEGPAPEELAAALDEAGVTPEELAEAVSTVQELEQAGVAPEEIIAAVQSATGDAEAPVDKVAAQRQTVIQKHLGLLKAAE